FGLDRSVAWRPRASSATGGGDARKVLDGELLTARLGIHPGGPEDVLGRGRRPGPATQRGPQRLAALGEGRVDDGEHCFAIRARRGIVLLQRDKTRVNVRR